MTFYGLESVNAVLRTTKSVADLTEVQKKMKSIRDMFYKHDLTIPKRITNVIGMYPSLPRNSIYKFIRYYPVGQQDVKTIPIIGKNRNDDSSGGGADGDNTDTAPSKELKNLPKYFKIATKAVDKPMFGDFESLPQFQINTIAGLRRLISSDVLERFKERDLDTTPVDDQYMQTLAQIVGLDIETFRNLKNVNSPRSRTELAQSTFYLMAVDYFEQSKSTENLKLLWEEIKKITL